MRWGIGFGILLATCVRCCAGSARAGIAQDLRPTIIAATPPSDGDPAWGARFALDRGTDRYVTDYAAAGGSGTFIDFDFGRPVVLQNIVYTNRTTSGSFNGSFVGGLYDYVSKFDLIFSNSKSFATPVGVLHVNDPYNGPAAPPFAPDFGANSVADFRKSVAVPEIEARYVRWRVTATNADDGTFHAGAADFRFTGTVTAVPLPSAAWAALPVIGAIFVVTWRRRRA